jgi:hypothetical protein
VQIDQPQEVQRGRPPTPEEEFFLDWARRAYQGTLDRVDAAVRELAVITTVLFGGSLAFFEDKVFNPSFRVPVTIFFLLALLVSLAGCYRLGRRHPYAGLSRHGPFTSGSLRASP